MLLKKRKAVVYLIKAEDKNGFYYEFKPDRESTTITTTVYPERSEGDGIDSLKNKSTYYVVDPGATRSNCNPFLHFKPKVVIVASPNDCYWNAAQFSKSSRSRKKGKNIKVFFKYFPLWRLQKLQDSQPIMYPTLTSETIKERHYKVGGVPQLTFEEESEFLISAASQRRALSVLAKGHATKIAKGEMDAVESLSSNQPRSALIGYKHAKSDDMSFDEETVEVVIISAIVAETIYTKFMSYLWDVMLERGQTGWSIFEAYTRELMIKKTPPRFEGRPCVPKLEKKDELEKIPLGGCNEIQFVQSDIVKCAMDTPKVVFHSLSSTYPLIDFVYGDETGIHAFHATIGSTHTCNRKHLKDLKDKIGRGKS